MNRYKNKSYRVVALCAAVFVLLLFVYMSRLQLQHAGHCCEQEPCPICIYISQSVNRMGELGIILGICFGIMAIPYLMSGLTEMPERQLWAGLTPVRLKTRMDN